MFAIARSGIILPMVMLSPMFLGTTGASGPANASAADPIPRGPSAKKASVTVTTEMRANAARNAERYEWAAKRRDATVRAAKRWVEMSDEALWLLPASQDMPRDNTVNRKGDGCPACGKEHFNAPYNPSRWLIDIDKHPWQVECANCGQRFPTNDFAAYYESALDEHGFFRLGKGDPKFLEPTQNGGNPAWVDDGTGIEVDGKKWFAAAGYASRLWRKLIDVVHNLARAYALTDDPKYAHKAGVLLDRIADMYPDMDFNPHYRRGMEFSSGGSGRGRIQGQIWENFTATKLAEAYDLVYDALARDKDLAAFSSRMSAAHNLGDKSSPNKVIDHVENNLVKEFIEAALAGQIVGNVGFQQRTMATVAIALDHPEITPRYLDWLFTEDGGKIPYIMREVLCREGLGNEAAVGYSSIPGKMFAELAWMLRRYEGYDRHDLYRDYPKFRRCYTMGAAVRGAGRVFPNWGDSNKCMNMGRYGLTLPAEMALQGYRVYGGRDIAREVWLSNHKSLDRVKLDAFDAEPEAVLESLRRDLALELAGEQPSLRSYNSGGYGCAFLEAGRGKSARSMMFYYGRMLFHGHRDRLAIQMVAHDVWAIPDLGYPLYTGRYPKRIGWTSHVISHNTVMVNDTNPHKSASYSGRTRLFDERKPVAVAEIDGDGPAIYEGVKTYARCLVMVDVDDENSYVVDVFRVRGGKNHRLIQNAGGPEAEVGPSLKLKWQEKGTYAGEDVDYGQFYDGDPDWHYNGTGFMFLKDVARGKTDLPFWADWPLVDPRRTMPEGWNAHLRVHNLSQVDEVAMCTGVPPEYKGNPPALRYMLRSRFGENLETQFLSVIEPYNGAPIIREVRALHNTIGQGPGDARAALEVVLADGRRDVILVAEEPANMSTDGVKMHGRIGFVRYDGDGNALAARLFEGTQLHAEAARIALDRPAWTGRLERFDMSDTEHTRLYLDSDVPPKGLEGKAILFENSERSDAGYPIVRYESPRTLDIGPTSLVERFVDPEDYSKGLIYNIAPGDRFRIARSGAWDAQPVKEE